MWEAFTVQITVEKHHQAWYRVDLQNHMHSVNCAHPMYTNHRLSTGQHGGCSHLIIHGVYKGFCWDSQIWGSTVHGQHLRPFGEHVVLVVNHIIKHL